MATCPSEYPSTFYIKMHRRRDRCAIYDPQSRFVPRNAYYDGQILLQQGLSPISILQPPEISRDQTHIR